ncbi:MAG: alpha/beta hydrolase [Actinomycetota bacterium]|nr:alpha/beta hydrolase [Actinomycetota bacterium]
MARPAARIKASIRNGVLRSGPDPDYADGDDASWLEVDWPALTRTEQVGDATINFIDTGTADDPGKPVLLFLHGLSGLWQNWLLTIPAFMDEYRCVAPDVPGFGASTLDREDITIRGYAEIIDAFCQRIGVRRAVVVGNSMGGFIAAELALSFPTRVEKLVLVSAAGLSIEYVRPEPLLAFGYFVTKSRVQSLIPYGRAIARPGLRRLALQMFVRYPEKLSLPLAWELVQGTGRAALLHALKALTSYSFRDRLTEIEIPVLIVWGENDLLVPVGDAARFERLIGANARSVIFEDTGHGPMIERPTRFSELLRGFLAEEARPEDAVPGTHAPAE